MLWLVHASCGILMRDQRLEVTVLSELFRRGIRVDGIRRTGLAITGAYLTGTFYRVDVADRRAAVAGRGVAVLPVSARKARGPRGSSVVAGRGFNRLKLPEGG